MVYSSMEKLLKLFPYFLKKSSDSNFYKSEYVFNEQFKEIYNDLFQVYESFHLEKRLCVWREQQREGVYSINFWASYPYLKSVTCYKNDIVIYSESFEYEDEIDTFHYIYDGSSENIIPKDKFKIIVETYEEYTLTKGFPENDESIGDIFDHDPSLDEFGLLYNTPRKHYQKVYQYNNDYYYTYKGDGEPPDDITFEQLFNDDNYNIMNKAQLITYYEKTEFPFNNQLTEDDYHYMNRLLQYINYYHKLPLPVIEIWKLYGLDPENTEEVTFINRERYLCKMFEENRHTINGEYNNEWVPERWEHKDPLWCPRVPETFFFVDVNNASPVQGQTIIFDYSFVDEFARTVGKDYYIIPYIRACASDDCDSEFEKYSEGYYQYTKEFGFLWNVPTNDIPHIDTCFMFDFVFRAYENKSDMEAENTNYLESDVIRIIIKGCNNADFYVDCVDGDDNNPGTNTEPFRTLTYAVSQAHGSENVIVLKNKNERFYIDNVLKFDETCSILSCPAGAIVYQNNGWDFFKSYQDTRLYLQGIILKHKCCEMHSVSTEFSNENKVNYPFTVTIPKWICKDATKINMTSNTLTVHAHRNLKLDGTLLTDIGDYEVGEENTIITSKCPTSKKEADLPVPNEELKLYLNNTLLYTKTTNNQGKYSFNHTFTNIGVFKLNVIHEESTKYCNSNNHYIVTVEAMPTTLTVPTAPSKMFIEDSFTIPYTVTDYYNNPVTVGTIKLYEDNKLVKTINNGGELNYTPTVAGLHSYKIVWSQDNTYVSSEFTFECNVVKYATRLFLIGEGKSIYMVDEDISLSGILTDELDQPIKNASVRLYDGESLIRTLTTDANGNISYTGKLSKGIHSLHLEFTETSKYQSAVSNIYRVKVRDSALADIQLYLYPEHKITRDLGTVIPLHVYACNKQGEPLSTSFKIWDTYNSGCESNTSPVYTTGDDGWWSGDLTTDAIVECQGTYIQAVSTIDIDVHSNVAHIRYIADPELEVTPSLIVDKSVYSYSNELININASLIDEEIDPVPLESATIEVYADNTLVKTLNCTTDVLGEIHTSYTTNNNVRGKDLTFKLIFPEKENAYKECSDETTVTFKQLSTTILSEDINVITSQKFNIVGSVVDENNIPADTGAVTVTVDGVTYNGNLNNGNFSISINKLFTPSTYPITINYSENTFYKQSSKNTNLIVNKIQPSLSVEQTHLFVVGETGEIPYEFQIPEISPKTSSSITVSGTLKLQKANNNIITEIEIGNPLDVLFDTETTLSNCKLVYSGNTYLEPVTITGITIKVTEPLFNIIDTESSPWDVNILNEFPSDESSYDEDDYIIIPELAETGDKMIITNDPDDTSVTGDNDIILVDSDSDDPNIVIKKETNAGDTRGR